MSRPDLRRSRRGFTLIEVLAAFVIALLMIVPITAIIGRVSTSMGALDRSVERRVEFRSAMAAAQTVPLRTGRVSVGAHALEVVPYRFDRSRDLQRAGWEIYKISVTSSNGRRIETVRIGRR